MSITIRPSHTTYYHVLREELEELNDYHLFLQDAGLLTDEVYFNCGSPLDPSTGIIRVIKKRFEGFYSSAI